MEGSMCPPLSVESVPSLSGSPMPWLLFSHSTDDVQAFSTAPFNNEPNIRNIPALRGKTICGSQFGWLVLLDDNTDTPDCYTFSLWNPVTLKSINLPPLNYHHTGYPRKTFLLTSPPSDDNDDGDDDCFLFFCFQLSYQAFVCRCLPKRGNDKKNLWYSQILKIEGERLCLSRAVVLRGVIYALSHTRLESILISINFFGDDASNPLTLKRLQLKLPNTSFSDLLCESASHLVESCGSIYLVEEGTQFCDGAHDAKVWMLDLQQQIWVEINCLGDRAFFLCFYNSTWAWANTTDHSKTSWGVEGNCLYIYDYMADEKLVMYNLTDCSSTLLPFGINDTWSESVFWVMPQHRWFVSGQDGKNLIDDLNNDVSNSCLRVSTIECKLLLEQNETQVERLSELPRDLIKYISRYMHLFDYWNFRCISKLIQSSTMLPLWRTNNSFPLFVVFENDGGLCRLMDPCRDDFRSCIFQSYENGRFDILYSKDGWLLVSDCKTLEYLNPFTRERGDLPDIIRYGSALTGFSSNPSSIGFSTDPTCSKCLTVITPEPYPEHEMMIDYYKCGDLEWTSCLLDNGQDHQFGTASGSPVFHSGAFYWLDTVGHLGVFEMADEYPSWRVYNSPFVEPCKLHSCYLVECGGYLLSVFIGLCGNDLEVFRFQQTEKKWIDAQSLGNYTLFLKSNSSTSVATNDTKIKNRIYLPLIQGNHIVYYSLETKKYCVNNTEASPNNFFFKKIPLRCCWI